MIPFPNASDLRGIIELAKQEDLGEDDVTSRLLIDAFGKERADDLLSMVRRSQEAAQGNLAELQRTDPLQLGYGREALIGIRVHGDVRIVADKVAAIDEANYVVLTAGSFDIIAEVIAEDDNDLVHLLNDSIRSIPGVTEVETFLYLKLAKQTYAWGEK